MCATETLRTGSIMVARLDHIQQIDLKCCLLSSSAACFKLANFGIQTNSVDPDQTAAMVAV